MPSISFCSGASPHYFSDENAVDGSSDFLCLPNQYFTIRDYWALPLRYLAAHLSSLGWSIIPAPTRDCPVDLLWILDLPAHRDSLSGYSGLSSHVIVQVAESPLRKPQSWVLGNYPQDWHVLAYDRHFVGPNVSHYYLPFRSYCTLPAAPTLSFEQRRPYGMIATRHDLTLVHRLHRSLVRLRGRSCGWELDWHSIKSRIIRPPFSRLELIQTMDQLCPHDFDLVGSGWDRTNSRFGFLPSRRPPRTWRERILQPLGAKIHFLSFYRFSFVYENLAGDFSYLSEKLFDCFAAGTVPVYFGSSDISRWCPPGAIVHLSDFSTPVDLIRYLSSISAAEWSAMLATGRDCLRSGVGRTHFSPESFVSIATPLTQSLVGL